MPTIRQHEVDAATWQMLNSLPSIGTRFTPAPASPPSPPAKPSGVAVAEPDGSGWSITLVLPCRVTSEMNDRGHWSARSRRFKHQGQVLRRVWDASPLSASSCLWERLLPFTVTFTRVGKRKFDSDNLAGGFKGLRDALADLLGIDDGDERIDWRYRQEAGTPGVRVCIESPQ